MLKEGWLTRYCDGVGARRVQADRTEEYILRRPIERHVVRFEPDAIFVRDRDGAGAEISDPAAADIIDFQRAEPPYARAVRCGVDDQVRRRPKRDRRAGANKHAAASEGPPAFTPTRFGGLFAQNAWPKLM